MRANVCQNGALPSVPDNHPARSQGSRPCSARCFGALPMIWRRATDCRRSGAGSPKCTVFRTLWYLDSESALFRPTHRSTAPNDRSDSFSSTRQKAQKQYQERRNDNTKVPPCQKGCQSRWGPPLSALRNKPIADPDGVSRLQDPADRRPLVNRKDSNLSDDYRWKA